MWVSLKVRVNVTHEHSLSLFCSSHVNHVIPQTAVKLFKS